MRVLKGKRKTLETPKNHNHNHKYNTRSKRNCYLCSSTQGCVAAKEPDIQNQNQNHLTCVSTQNACPIRLVGRRQGVIRYKTLVACAHSSAFPDDLLFNILLLIPAKLLHENMRFVSRIWRQTITSSSFITNHLQISSANHTHHLLIDSPYQQIKVAFYVKPPTSGHNANPEFQVTELEKPPFDCLIRGSYHGLVLLQHEVNRDRFYVANLVTKSIVSLPSFPLLAIISKFPDTILLNWTGIAFSYASSINRYKVVIAIHPPHLPPASPLVWVYTVGVDRNWRRLKLPPGIDKIYCTIYPAQIPFHTPRSVGGFVYWSGISFPYGVALDVDTETFHPFTPAPTAITDDLSYYWIICLQTGLGVVITCKFGALWKLYQLTDLKSSKWTKIIDIDVRAIRSQIEKYLQSTHYPLLTPLVYTNDEKLWFLANFSSVIVFYYDLREKHIVPVPFNGEAFSAYHHVNTLLSCAA